MAEKTIEYITWHPSPHWTSNIILGNSGQRYLFKSDWNNRDQSWAVTISLNNEVLLQGIKLVLNVDLLRLCYNTNKPDCVLYAATDNDDIQRIDYDNMISGDVKLYHILPEDLIE